VISTEHRTAVLVDQVWVRHWFAVCAVVPSRKLAVAVGSMYVPKLTPCTVRNVPPYRAPLGVAIAVTTGESYVNPKFLVPITPPTTICVPHPLVLDGLTFPY
jgi:hypothetical protein